MPACALKPWFWIILNESIREIFNSAAFLSSKKTFLISKCSKKNLYLNYKYISHEEEGKDTGYFGSFSGRDI
jgi:hypothetical protein